MRIDVVSIFPDYLAPLGLSLVGKAQESGLIDVHVHDLRQWTHDRHRTVDDTPYGGGAGMVMKPEPWGEALDAVVPTAEPDERRATLVVPTPAGEPFTQAVAADLATRDHLVFACGRYEGIDQRVMDHAASRMEVRELSIGDYVLNGGEVAALAIVEAVVRLLPGFMGNAESLTEESHAAGLLEYPVYTKPDAWRGHQVPDVLLSGDHARIARGATTSPYDGPPNAALTSPTPRPPSTSVSSRAGSRSPYPPMPPSCSPCSGRAGSRSSRRTRAWRSRRTRRAWPTCRRGCRSGPRSCSAPAAASSVPRAPTGSARPGTSAGSWSPRTCRAEGSVGCC